MQMTEAQKQQLSGCKLEIENTVLTCQGRHAYCPTECPLRLGLILFHKKYIHTEKMNQEYDELCSGYTVKDLIIAGIDTV